MDFALEEYLIKDLVGCVMRYIPLIEISFGSLSLRLRSDEFFHLPKEEIKEIIDIYIEDELIFSSPRLFFQNAKICDITGKVILIGDASGMFNSASRFHGDLKYWDVSKVTNMQFMFKDAKLFDSDLSRWNTESVTNMKGMFKNASNFRSNLEKWNTRKVRDARDIFSGASMFSIHNIPTPKFHHLKI